MQDFKLHCNSWLILFRYPIWYIKHIRLWCNGWIRWATGCITCARSSESSYKPTVYCPSMWTQERNHFHGKGVCNLICYIERTFPYSKIDFFQWRQRLFQAKLPYFQCKNEEFAIRKNILTQKYVKNSC